MTTKKCPPFNGTLNNVLTGITGMPILALKYPKKRLSARGRE